MKHAYLIIAHNEFVILQKLIDSLDDDRTDIYVLFDKKVKALPMLTTKKSGLTVLKNRVNIYWGHYSQIQAEMILFKEIAQKDYSYCHLISGVHLPLYSQEFLFDYFDKVYPKQVFSFLPTNLKEIDFKVKLRSFFIKYYHSSNQVISRLSQYSWVLFLKIQKIFNLRRMYYREYVKCSNWVCITQEAVNYLVNHEREIEENFKYTFCGDEFFVPTVLKNADVPFDFFIEERLLFQRFENTRATILKVEDYNKLIDSKALFARKFSEISIEVVEMVMNNYNKR